MKHFFKFTHIVAVAFAAVSMLGFTACNDNLGDQVAALSNEKSNLEEELVATTDSLQDQIDDLQSKVNDLSKIVSCGCEIKTAQDVAKIVGDSLKNYWNITEVQNYVNSQIQDWVLTSTYQTMIDSLRGALNDINTHLKQHCDSIGQLYTDVATLNSAVIKAQATANAAQALAKADSARIDGLSSRIDTLVTNIYTTVNNLAGRVTGLEGRMDTVEVEAANALALARMDSIRIDALQVLYTELHETDSVQQVQIDSIKLVIDSLATKAEVREVKALADSLYNKALHYSDSLHTIVMATLDTFDVRITKLENVLPIVRDSVQILNDSLVALQAEVATLKTQVEENTRNINKLTATVNDVFSKTIYGVLLQGTFNPVFGYYAMPFSSQSNVLMAYYGQNEHITYFPTVSTSDLVYEQYALTDDDAAMLGGTVDAFSIPGGTTFLSEGANGGKIFFTVNPSTADLSAAQFTLVNSLDEEAGIHLDTVKPCTEKLTFGYTGAGTWKAPVQGQANNGLYEAEAVLDEAGIPVAKLQIDSELKEAVKDFYRTNFKGKSARQVVTSFDPSSLTLLANGIYQQFNGLMPRYAVKATWTDSLGQHSVYSNYDAAAVAVKPLSYAFLKDRSFRHLPTINPLSDLSSSFDIKMKDIKFNVNFKLNHADANVHLDAITINLDTVQFKVVVDIPDVDYFQATGDLRTKKDTVYVDDLHELEDYFNARFATVVNGWNTKINAEINQQVNALIDSINQQLSDFTTDVQGQLNTQIQSVVDDAKKQVLSKFDRYIPRLNSFINKMNSLIARVNRLLDNPNKLLQTVMVYEGVDKHMHLMSTSKNLPTVFNGTGAIMIYPTSYTAEIAAPAYKKFIAVTNVFRGTASAQGGDAACTAALNAANSHEFFNEVIEGGRYGVAFVPTAGFTYEIFYSALDYSGKISQRKYYVTVK